MPEEARKKQARKRESKYRILDNGGVLHPVLVKINIFPLQCKYVKELAPHVSGRAAGDYKLLPFRKSRDGS